MSDGITRRGALTRGFGGIALVCSFKADTRAHGRLEKTSAFVRSASSTPFDPFQRDLPLPPVATPTAATKQLEQYAITMKPGTADILTGLETPVLGYDGLFPGPTIKATRGREVQVRQLNQSGRDLNVHLHGGVTEPHFDGHPHDFIPTGDASGSTSTRTSRARRRSGTTTTRTARRTRRCSRGWPASTCSTTPTTTALELPQGEYDVPLMIQDRSFNADGSFRYRFDLDRGFRGDTILVNGAVAPRMKVERRLYRLRFLNASNARAYKLELGNGRKMIQIGSDGGLLPGKPVARTSIPLEPAERVDVAGRLPPVRRRLQGRPAQHERRAVDDRGDALRRRQGRRRGGADAEAAGRGGGAARGQRMERSWPLTFQGLAGGGSVWQIAGGGFSENRIDCRRARARPSCGRG